MEKDSCAQPSGELTSQKFQQQLNQWFEENGILDNLRSHLRSLMITALQNTEIGIKPNLRTSPKTQSINLIVAEHLLQQGCHYTLSVLMSEVPFLANFGSGPTLRHCRSKLHEKKISYHFQETEIVEILNALGMPAQDEQLRNICDHYIRSKEEESFLECLLGLLPKIQLRQDSQRYETENRSRLSKEWSAQVSDLLLKARNTLQLSAAQELLSKITENEIKRTAEEESNRRIGVLIEREKRIQEYLKSYEEEIMEKLVVAEKELNARREIIDKELFERQLHLGRMAFQWQDKHNEIMALSKNFSTVKAENESLKLELGRLEEEVKKLKTEVEIKAEVIDRLEAEKNTFKSHVQEYLKWKTKKELMKSSPRREVEVSDNGTDPEMSEFSAQDSETSSGGEEVLLRKVKARLMELEEEDSKLNDYYCQYRKKWEEITNSESEVTNVPEEEEKGEVEERTEVKEEAVPLPKESSEESCVSEVVVPEEPKKPVVEEEPVSKVVLPTKRQQKDHEYYLQSRNLLDILEKSTGIVEEYTESASNLSLESTESSKGVGDASGGKEQGPVMCLQTPDDVTLALLKEATQVPRIESYLRIGRSARRENP